LTKENFDFVIRSGNDLILFLYSPVSPKSHLALEAIKEIDQMVGKNFDICLIDFSCQPEIAHALNANDPPETIIIKDQKIHRRKTGILYSNQILDLLK